MESIVGSVHIDAFMKTSRPEARFRIECDQDFWYVVDQQYSVKIRCEGERQALSAAMFARLYVRRHGDVNFRAFPTYLGDALDREQLERDVISAQNSEKDDA